MSYTKKIGDKEYEFASEKAYDTYYKIATSAAKQNGITIGEALEGNYQKYVDVNSPLIGAKKEETVQPVAPAQTVVPQYSDYTNLLDYADAYKVSAYANASDLRGASYEAALKARQEAEALAEIQRKRGVVDASTMAEQQKATYGANAEQLGRMGLNVSGYSDYLNSQAYANGMAYRQAANAQATDIKRQATYQEALARLEADKAYSQATAEADKIYYGAMKDIEAAKIAVAKAREQQKETNYQNFLASIPDNASKADVTKIAGIYGITDENEINEAISYAKAIGYTINDGSATTTPTANEDAIAKVFSHQEGEETVVNTKSQATVQYDKAKKQYDEAKKQYESGKMDEATWRNNEETWRVIEATFKMEYGDGNYVSIYSQTFDENSFGKFAKGKKQTDLISAIELMAKGELTTSDGNKLEKGDIVPVNYGNSGYGTYYKYDGDGGFVKTNPTGYGWYDIVVPNGFVWDQQCTAVEVEK